PERVRVKILVALKRVADPDNANKVKIGAGGTSVDTTGLEWKPNPFDEYALEAALRLTENGKAPKQRLGGVGVVKLGPKEAEQTLRGALATGADRAIRIDTTDDALDGRLVALALKGVVAEEKPDVVLLVGREVDGGVLTLRVTLPALVTVDLRVVAPKSVYSQHTEPSHSYAEGVRFAPLPAIMAAKKKPLVVKTLADYAPGVNLATRMLKFERPAARSAGVKVKDPAELVEKLANVAKVI